MAQAPDQPPESVIYSQFTGLKNTVTAERLSIAELEKAVNVDIDDVGQLHRRRGRTKVADGAFHSLWKTATYTLGVRDGMLGIVNPNYSFIELTHVGLEHISYTQVGDDVYFSSRSSSGIVRSNWQIDPWGTRTPENTWLSPVVNPTATLGEIGGKIIGPPPLATSIAYFNGRIYMAHEDTLWATELYLYNYVDKTKNFIRFTSNITGLGVVDDGIFVGTEAGVDFLSGPFGAMKRTPVADAGVIPGSMIQVPAEQVHPQARSGEPYPDGTAVMFLAKTGLCAGFNGGQSFNLTQNTMVFPDASNAAALFRRQDGVNSYVAVADSGGTPSSNARIGDYVDAEIRRFQGV